LTTIIRPEHAALLDNITNRKDSPAKRKRWKIIVLMRGFSLFLMAVLILSFEVYLRLSESHIIREKRGFLMPFPESDAEFLIKYTPKGRRLVPNSRVLIENHRISGRDVVVKINSLGFRDEEIQPPEPNEIRILVLGDSITWASYLPAEETYVERMEDYLRKVIRDRRVEVINAGVGDIGLKEEMAILREKGLGLEPAVVIVAFYLNDSRPPWGFPGELGHRGWLRRHSLLAETIYKNFKLRKWIKEQGKDRLAWTEAMRDFTWMHDREAFLRLAALANCDWGAAWEPESWEVIDRELDALKKLSEHHGFSTVVVAFPVAFQLYTRFVEDRPQRIIRDKCATRGFYYLDLLPLLRKRLSGEKKAYFDWCHPTAATNDFIGRKISEFLLRSLFNPGQRTTKSASRT